MKQKISMSGSARERPFGASLAFLGLDQKPRPGEDVEPERDARRPCSRGTPAPATRRRRSSARSSASICPMTNARVSEKGRQTAIIGRDREADEILDTLVRIKGKAPGADRPARLQVDDRATRGAARHRRRLSAVETLPADAGARALGRDHAEPADGALQRQQSRGPQAGGRALLRRRAGASRRRKRSASSCSSTISTRSTAIRSRR